MFCMKVHPSGVCWRELALQPAGVLCWFKRPVVGAQKQKPRLPKRGADWVRQMARTGPVGRFNRQRNLSSWNILSVQPPRGGGVGLHSKSTFLTQTKGGWFLYATGGNLWAKGREASVLQGFPEPPQHVQTSAAQKHTGGGGWLIKYSAANEWASVSLPLPVCDWRHGCFHGGDFLAMVESAGWVQLKFTATSRRREARRMVGDGVLLDIQRPEAAWLKERDRTS